MSKDKQPLIAVIGPTASGKTALGAYLAQKFGGEIVSADAKQVYRGMDIGTAKETSLAVPQHLINIKDPGELITVAEYQSLAYAVIDTLHAKSKLPFLVGGSGMYAEAVLNGYKFIEGKKSQEQVARYRVLKLGLYNTRQELRQRAALRTAKWLQQGLVGEIEYLLGSGVDPKWLQKCGMEYKYFTQYVQGSISLPEAERLTNIALGQFIKRQQTWWNRHLDIHWVKSPTEAEEIVRAFLA